MMSLLFNMLSRFVRAFLPRSKCLLISSTVVLEPKKIKSVTASTFSPYICHGVMGEDAMILVFLMLSFKPAFSLSSFALLKRLSPFRVVSFAYLRWLIILPKFLIPSFDSCSPAYCMIYSIYFNYNDILYIS